jgi:hypothetical protein
MNPDQILFRDLNRQHGNIALGACYQAIREIDGVSPSIQSLEQNFGRVVYEHGQFLEFTWKGRTIIRLYAPSLVKNKRGELIQFRKLEQVWKKKPGAV